MILPTLLFYQTTRGHGAMLYNRLVQVIELWHIRIWLMRSCLFIFLPWLTIGSSTFADELHRYETGLLETIFSLQDTLGKPISPAYLQDKVVLVNFWASWCGPCITEIPSLRRLYEQMSEKPFEILAVNVKEGAFKVHNFSRQVEMPFPILLDPEGEVFDSWQARVLPTSYLVDPSGQVRYRVQGPLEWTSPEVLDAIDSLLPD